MTSVSVSTESRGTHQRKQSKTTLHFTPLPSLHELRNTVLGGPGAGLVPKLLPLCSPPANDQTTRSTNSRPWSTSQASLLPLDRKSPTNESVKVNQLQAGVFCRSPRHTHTHPTQKPPSSELEKRQSSHEPPKRTPTLRTYPFCGPFCAIQETSSKKQLKS